MCASEHSVSGQEVPCFNTEGTGEGKVEEMARRTGTRSQSTTPTLRCLLKFQNSGSTTSVSRAEEHAPKPVFTSYLLVAARTALLPLKRQDRPVGSPRPSKKPFITASREGADLIELRSHSLRHLTVLIQPHRVRLILLLIVYQPFFDRPYRCPHPRAHLPPSFPAVRLNTVSAGSVSACR